MKKYGAEAAEKISNMNTQQAEKEGESELTKLQKEVWLPLPEQCLAVRKGAWDVSLAWQATPMPRAADIHMMEGQL